MSKSTDSNELLQKVTLSRIMTGILGLVIFTGTWFGIAGRVTWWQGWAFLLTFIGYTSILMWKLSKSDPELVRERMRPSGAAEAWDRAVMGFYYVMLLALWIVSALDSGRFTWSAISMGFQVVGWLFLIVAGVIIWHVMMTNAYLSSWARLQEDRGQVVIQDGLYGHIRHPMYFGIMVAFLGIPLLLNSWWALIPSVGIVGLFVYRTHREDQMLINGLAGYAKYTQKVGYRLLPGIW